ncbi:MAG: hypothetical protein ACR5LH_05370, partial [Sodalis sp. (in: enterobacteria)]
QLCGFELKFRRKMFTHEVTYRVGEVRISPPIRWPVSVCHYRGHWHSTAGAARFLPAIDSHGWPAGAQYGSPPRRSAVGGEDWRKRAIVARQRTVVCRASAGVPFFCGHH